MSGGHWDYSGHRIESDLQAIGEDDAVRKRFLKQLERLRVGQEQLDQILEEVVDGFA